MIIIGLFVFRSTFITIVYSLVMSITKQNIMKTIKFQSKVDLAKKKNLRNMRSKIIFLKYIVKLCRCEYFHNGIFDSS